MSRSIASIACAFAASTAVLLTGSIARAVPLTLDLSAANSHVTISSLFSGLPTTAQEGTAGTSDGVAGSPSNRTTFSGTITVDVDNPLAPSTIRILSSAANAATSGTWLPQVRPYQDLNGNGTSGDFGLPPEGDSEVATTTNFLPAASADWGVKVRHPAFGVDIMYGAYRDVSYDVSSAAAAVVAGQFSSASQQFRPDGFLDYWVAPAAGGLLGRTDAATGTVYGNTAAPSSYTVTPLGGGNAQVTLLIPILVDDMGATIRSTYTGQFLASAIVPIPEPACLLPVVAASFFLARPRTGPRRR